jgi:carbon storage regulator
MLKRDQHVLIYVSRSEGSHMLILSRRVGEALIIDKEVKVHVLGVNGNQIRIGIDAPKHVSVHREEVYQRIHQAIKK